MNFSWTKEQLAKKKQAITFAQDNLNDNLVERNRKGLWSWDAWRKSAEFGLQGLTVPEEYGGSNTDIMTAVLIMEGIGYGCRENAMPYALGSHIWCTQLVLQQFGSEHQKQKYLTKMVSGEWIGAFGITEEETGSDSYAMQTAAKKVEGGYILNGTKAYITFAPICQFAVVFAMTNPELGRWGVSAFLVDKETAGFTTPPVDEKMGMRSLPFGQMVFEDCFVPDENLLGAEGTGVSIFTRSTESERSFIYATQLGRMERQLEENIAYVRRRKAFGQPIGKFQSVSNRIVEMKMRLETGRMLLYKVAWLEQQGKPLMMEAAMTKLYLSEMFVDSSLDAIRNYGTKGYMTEFEAERDLRDSVGGLLYAGTSDIQRNIIARLLGL